MKRRKAAKPQDALIDKRREIIASLLVRGMSQIEIRALMAHPTIEVQGKQVTNPAYLINPNTNEPFDTSQICRDVAAIRTQWRKQSLEHVDEFFAEQLANLRELRRINWERGDYVEVRQAIALEIKLTGTAKPERVEHRMDDNQFEAMQTAKDRIREKLSMMMPIIREADADEDTNG